MEQNKTKLPQRLIAFVLVFSFSLTTLTPSASAKASRTWEDFDSERHGTVVVQTYDDVMDVGEACAATFENHKGKDDAYLGLVGQMFISPAADAKFELAKAQRKYALSQEIKNYEAPPLLLGQMERDSTQIYLNQLLYNWKVQSKIFRGTSKIDLGKVGFWPEIDQADKVSKTAVDSNANIPNAIDPIILQQHVKVFNAMITAINDTCSDATLSYTHLMDAYNHSDKQDPASNPILSILLGDQENFAIIDGGIKGAIRKRIQEIKNLTTFEAALYKAIISQTMFGKMYEVDTQLKNKVGEYNTIGCVERGQKLNLLPANHHELWVILGNSYGYLDWKYQKAIHDTLDTYGEKDSQEVLEEYAQNNPGTLQQMLIASSSKQQAMATCQIIHDIRTKNGIKNGINAILAPVTILASMMTAGAASATTASWIAYASLILNGYFFGSTIMDLSLSYDLEDKLNASILGNQIDTSIGQNMIKQVQSARPFSYINLGLSGLGVAAATARLSQLSKIKAYREYLDAKGGSTPKKFKGAQTNFLASQSKGAPLTRTKLGQIAHQLRALKNPGNKILDWISGKKPATEPQGVPHNVANIKNYLDYIKNEKNAGNSKLGYGDDLYYKIPDPKTPPRGPITTRDPVTGRKPINLQTSTYTKPQGSVEVAVKTKTLSPTNRFEIEPDIVPMPVEPYVVPMPVLPDVIESPEASNKAKEFLESQKQSKVKRAEQVLENDLNETDQAVIDEIQSIANGVGDLAKKAKEWLSRHRLPISSHSHYSTSESSVHVKNKLQIEKEFLYLDNLNSDLIKHLKAGNENAAKLANEKLISSLSQIVEKYNFKFDILTNEADMNVLRILPTPETKFYRTLSQYTKKLNADPVEYYRIIFNPGELHFRFAAASVTDATVDVGLDSIKNILLNEIEKTELHEIRHLYYQFLRKTHQASLYHQGYSFSSGPLNTTNTYEHYVSAEEIPAYGNDLKEEVSLIRNITDTTRRNLISDKEWVNFESMDSTADTLLDIDIGILRSSAKFLKAINNRSYSLIELGSDSTHSVYLTLDTGEELRVDFISEEERAIFINFMNDRQKNLIPLLEVIYTKQLQLNHLAYKQIIYLAKLTNAIAHYNKQIDDLDNEHETFVFSNLDGQINDIEFIADYLRTETFADKINFILNTATLIYQMGKETGSSLTVDLKQGDDELWQSVISEPFVDTNVNQAPNTSERKNSDEPKKSSASKDDYETPSYGAGKYGDEKFLDHLVYNVDDPQQNLVALFRGVSTFYKDTGTLQVELELFSKWVLDNFSFTPFWGRNMNGIDWGYSYLQMWPKANFATGNVSPQFDVVFLVDEKNRPFILVKIPKLNMEELYDFHDFVAHKGRYVGGNKLSPSFENKSLPYSYFTTNEQYNVTEPTIWMKEAYEIDYVPSTIIVHESPLDDRVPANDHLLIHVVDEESRYKSSGLETPETKVFIEQLKSIKMDLDAIKKLPFADSRERSSTRILKINEDETYFVKFYEPNTQVNPSHPNPEEFEKNKKYSLTDLEYSVFIADQHFGHRYAPSFLISIDGENVFFTKKQNLIQFNYVDFLGNKYDRIPFDHMARIYLMNHPTSQGPVNFSMPEDVILFDLLMGNIDRSITNNVNLIGNEKFFYKENKNPLVLNKDQYDVMIFDGGLSFMMQTEQRIKDSKSFWNWYEEYFFNPLTNKNEDPKIVIQQLLLNNPSFVEHLKNWNEDQIKSDMNLLKQAHMDQFLVNRRFLLQLAENPSASNN